MEVVEFPNSWLSVGHGRFQEGAAGVGAPFAHPRGEEGSLPCRKTSRFSPQNRPSPYASCFFADSANRKAFRDGIKPGWHYFGRKMVSKERIQPSQLATGKAELFFFCS